MSDQTEWVKYIEDDHRTHPEHGYKVIGLIVWSKGKDCRFGSILEPSSMREADFYEAVYGFYCRKRDLMNFPEDADDADDIVFALDHGEQDYNNSDDYRETIPLWWTYIDTPQELDLDLKPKDTQ